MKRANQNLKFQQKTLRSNTGFTLIEGLVVIAILAVLTGVLLPVAMRMVEKSDEAGCLSNLRQIGAALHLYLGENNQRFPGPLHSAQAPGYTQTSTTQLAYHLSTYLGLPGPSSERQYAKVFVSPGHLRKVPISEQPRSYRIRADHASGYLFGYPGSGSHQPKTLYYASQSTGARTWILQDIDQTIGGPPSTPTQPLHRRGRTTLFLDGSVQLVPFDQLSSLD